MTGLISKSCVVTVAIDRIVNRGANAVYRITHKHGNGQSETADDLAVNRSLKKSDSNEFLAGK